MDAELLKAMSRYQAYAITEEQLEELDGTAQEDAIVFARDGFDGSTIDDGNDDADEKPDDGNKKPTGMITSWLLPWKYTPLHHCLVLFTAQKTHYPTGNHLAIHL